MKVKRTIRIEMTIEQAAALRDRLIPISPASYQLEDYAFLRNLYGRLDHLVMQREIREVMPFASPPVESFKEVKNGD